MSRGRAGHAADAAVLWPVGNEAYTGAVRSGEATGASAEGAVGDLGGCFGAAAAAGTLWGAVRVVGKGHFIGRWGRKRIGEGGEWDKLKMWWGEGFGSVEGLYVRMLLHAGSLASLSALSPPTYY